MDIASIFVYIRYARNGAIMTSGTVLDRLHSVVWRHDPYFPVQMRVAATQFAAYLVLTLAEAGVVRLSNVILFDFLDNSDCDSV